MNYLICCKLCKVIARSLHILININSQIRSSRLKDLMAEAQAQHQRSNEIEGSFGWSTTSAIEQLNNLPFWTTSPENKCQFHKQCTEIQTPDARVKVNSTTKPKASSLVTSRSSKSLHRKEVSRLYTPKFKPKNLEINSVKLNRVNRWYLYAASDLWLSVEGRDLLAKLFNTTVSVIMVTTKPKCQSL